MIKYVISVILVGFLFYGCAIKIDRYEEIRTKEDKKLYVISDLRFKTFIFNNDNDSVFIKSPFEEGFKKMILDPVNKKNEYEIKIGDYKYYRRMKKDTIIIKIENKIEKYMMIKSE